MEARFMKKLMSVVVFNLQMFHTEAGQFYIRNLSDDSIGVNVSFCNPNVTVIPWRCDFDNSKILGRSEQPCGRGGHKREKHYDVSFNGYIPTPGEEPYILFENDRAKFKLVFLEENYAELRSDQASEIHDDPGRREYDRNHPYNKDRSYRPEDEYAGTVRHWMVVGPYAIVYCYERYNFPVRCIDILESTENNSWIPKEKEGEFDLLVGVDPPHRYPPQPPKRSCQSWLCGCCCCCDD
jgi:hypothetical protein